MFLSVYPALLIPATFTDLRFLIIVIITIIIVLILQAITKDPRPNGKGYGFPSAHATITTLLTIWIIRELKRRKVSEIVFVIISLILTILLILVCISRVNRGYHTVMQVIAGIFLGIIATLIYFNIIKLK
jgi:membrane-associated phospholipid phosphatase